jgi:hypothetical protein
MASGTYFSSLSPAIGADWGKLAPAVSPVLHPERLSFFDASFSFLFARSASFEVFLNESPAISVFYTRRHVNGF